jgi:hypothetical protein
MITIQFRCAYPFLFWRGKRVFHKKDRHRNRRAQLLLRKLRSAQTMMDVLMIEHLEQSKQST